MQARGVPLLWGDMSFAVFRALHCCPCWHHLGSLKQTLQNHLIQSGSTVSKNEAAGTDLQEEQAAAYGVAGAVSDGVSLQNNAKSWGFSVTNVAHASSACNLPSKCLRCLRWIPQQSFQLLPLVKSQHPAVSLLFSRFSTQAQGLLSR